MLRTILEEMFNLNKTVPLKKRGDINYELDFQTQLIINKGFEVIKTIEADESKLILYRHFYNDTKKEEETNIILSLRVITKQGILYPEPVLKAFFNEDFTEIDLADIDIKDYMSNKGYGSLLLSKLIDIAKTENVSRISGWISSVDIDHIERLNHFYKKHGFHVQLNENLNNINHIGDIYWINK